MTEAAGARELWAAIDLSHPEDFSECPCEFPEQHVLVTNAIGAKRCALELYRRMELLGERARFALDDPDQRGYADGLRHALIGAYGLMRGVEPGLDFMAEATVEVLEIRPDVNTHEHD